MKVLISEKKILSRVKEIALEVNTAFSGQKVDVLVCMNGAFMFASELLKELSFVDHVFFSKLTSYVDTKSTGHVSMERSTLSKIKNSQLLVIEDIVDTGRTLFTLHKELKDTSDISITTITMLDKPSKREIPVVVDYIGFEIEDHFVIGHGLDLNQKYRDLRDICIYEN